ncbi:hypothetical protein MTR67_043976 [Solanum verrucosum]|uniref:Mitochondrial protein n=1 Tax=Solanum verrucosum TaxID=315347 RepID=A0AAF0UT07_SOLVR|nr:hypothetical protein MTR67_043976 [Solanum verrucosum]
MHQRKYVMDLILDFALSGSKPIATPIELNQKLTTCELDTHIGDSQGPFLVDPRLYQRLVSRLLYLTITRPVITFDVQSFSQFVHASKQSHLEAALRVVKYIKQSPSIRVLMSSSGSNTLQGFFYVDWGSYFNTRKSIIGYMAKFGDSPISWKSKKQPTIFRS